MRTHRLRAYKTIDSQVGITEEDLTFSQLLHCKNSQRHWLVQASQFFLQGCIDGSKLQKPLRWVFTRKER